MPAQFTGITSEWLIFDAHQQPAGRLVSQATNLNSSSTGIQIVLRQQLFETTEVVSLTTELPAQIGANGSVRLDVRTLLSANLLKVLKLQRLKTELDSLAIVPTTDAHPGDLLPEAHLILSGKEMGRLRGVDIISEGRWVEDQETVTTTAGTFFCLHLKQNLRINHFIDGERHSYKVQVETWFAPNTGIVKQDTYYGGKMLETMVLNRVIPPGGPNTAEVRSR